MYLNAAFILPKKVLLNSLIMTSHRIQWVTTLGVTVKEETQPLPLGEKIQLTPCVALLQAMVLTEGGQHD